MTTAYTSLLGLALPVTGELSGTWGDTVNNSITSLLDSAVAGTTNVSTDGDVTLTTTTGAANTAREAILLFSGARTALRTVTAPAQSKVYTVINATTGGYAVKLVGSGPTTGVTIVAGESAVCAWNGSDFVKVSNAGGSSSFVDLTVSGNVTLSGGTANGVTYLNGSKVLTSGSALTFDGTNFSTTGTVTGNGRSKFIGASEPFSIYLRYNGSTSGAYLGSSATDTLNSYDSAGNQFFQFSPTSDIFYVGGSEQMRLTSTGLGIGTSSPGAKLDVISSAARIAYLRSSNATGGYFSFWDSANSLGRGYIGYGPAVITGASQADLCIAPDAGGATRFGNPGGSATYAVIDSSGNLGIGTSSPATKLDVASTNTATDSIGNVFIKTTDTQAADVGGKLTLGGLYNGSSYYAFGGIAGKKENSTSGNVAGYLQFLTTTSAGALTERARIDSSGNLGLGVTPSAWASPFGSGVFELSGAYLAGSAANGIVRFGQNHYYNGSNYIYKANGYASAFLQNSGAFQFYTAPSGTAGNAITFSQAMTLDASGNLLVSTTSVNQKLTINGGIGALANVNATTGSLGVVIGTAGSATGTSDTAYIVSDNGGYGGYNDLIISPRNNTGAVGNLRLYTGGAERARIDSSGNLLVGKTVQDNTTVGSYIQGNGHIGVAATSSTNADNSYVMYSTGAGAYRFYVDFGGTIHATSIVITAISDERLKENVRDLDTGLSTVMALKPRRYDWKEGQGLNKKNAAGFIAQEFETVFPDSVGKSLAGEDGIEYKNINYEELIPTLTKAIQEQQAIIESLKARLDAANL